MVINMFHPAKRVELIDLSLIRKMFDYMTEDSINLGLGEPDFSPPLHILNAVKDALDSGFTHYTVNRGIIELRNAISSKLYNENKLSFNSDEILVTVGASEALFICTQAMIEKGDEVLVPDPGFVTYDACVKLSDGKSVSVKLSEENEFRMNTDDVLDKITDKTKAIFINSPSNPTGAVLKKDDVKGIADIATDHEILIISDEIYEKIIYEGKHYSPAQFCDNVIVINGFSKTYAMTGFRIGYVAANPYITEEMLKIHQYNTACASSISQKAALAALEGPQDSVDQMVKEFKRRRDLIIYRLKEMGIKAVQPKGAFYSFPKIKDPEFFVTEALKRDVILVPGLAFGKNGSEYIRLSYATSFEKLEKAMNILESIDFNQIIK
jgi:aspartate aminotransferase